MFCAREKHRLHIPLESGRGDRAGCLLARPGASARSQRQVARAPSRKESAGAGGIWVPHRVACDTTNETSPLLLARAPVCASQRRPARRAASKHGVAAERRLRWKKQSRIPERCQTARESRGLMNAHGLAPPPGCLLFCRFSRGSPLRSDAPANFCQASGLIAHDASESNPPPGCAASSS